MAKSQATFGSLRDRRTRTPVFVVINEVMTNNETIFADGDGDFPDWIEFYNYGERPADLSGHSLSDKDTNLDKWVFPAGTILGPGEYLVVFASGKNWRGNSGRRATCGF